MPGHRSRIRVAALALLAIYRLGRRTATLTVAVATTTSTTVAAATLIITGFIARTADGLQTTLGRNGSDFSASIMGDLLDASGIVIWTDVDGVMTANPSEVPEARTLSEIWMAFEPGDWKIGTATADLLLSSERSA